MIYRSERRKFLRELSEYWESETGKKPNLIKIAPHEKRNKLYLYALKVCLEAQAKFHRDEGKGKFVSQKLIEELRKRFASDENLRREYPVHGEKRIKSAVKCVRAELKNRTDSAYK